ncbi:cytochrome P450 81D1-like [Hibiscus syriacus]|uniref:Cytochrome P450 81D1-like n=1 Tax=Hibiscus syriacus TaxID=106335 RepID=A0A6A2XFK0_HIBSY|nr:cytochrome P450 81D1-like [Hibiscus syriacus]
MSKLVVEVVEAIDLMHKDEQGSSSPFVEVEFDGQRQRTQTKHKDLNPSWNQKLVFDVNNLGDLEYQTLGVTVYNDRQGDRGHNRKFLGRVKISGGSVPSSESGSGVQHYPLDKCGLFSNIKGEIALKIYAVHDGVPQEPVVQCAVRESVVAENEEIEDAEAESGLPVGGNKTAGGGTFAVPGGDKTSTTYDLVEQMHYLSESWELQRANKHLEKNQNPVWHQIFAFSKERVQSSLLEVVVKDKDFGKDDFVGKVVFDVMEIPLRVPPDSPLAPQWYRLADNRAQDLVPHDKGRLPDPYVKVAVGNQIRPTKVQQRTVHPVWDDQLMFVTSEPFEDYIIISVEDRIGPGKDEILGKAMIPLREVPQILETGKPPDPRWFNLLKPSKAEEEGEKKKEKFSSKILLRFVFEAGYHVLDESTHFSSDLQPSSKHLRKPSIGILELGVLSARNLLPMKMKEVDDPCTVIAIGVFDNGHTNGSKDDARDQKIGKVRVRLSTLEIDLVYTHYYPLLVLTPSGLKKHGELQLALRLAAPPSNADCGSKIAKSRATTEVVEYMLDVDYHMWSLRRSKANFYRIMSVLSGVTVVCKWFNDICYWRNPITTCLVHVLFLILVCYPELILPTIFLYLFVIGIWNYRFRPRHPPHMDARLSQADNAHPDELDEEFDSVQTVVGDLASQGERAQAILSWRDSRATAIFIILSLIWAVFIYVTTFQAVVVLFGLYWLRHPRFRSKLPSAPVNFFKRLPSKSDMLI